MNYVLLSFQDSNVIQSQRNMTYIWKGVECITETMDVITFFKVSNFHSSFLILIHLNTSGINSEGMVVLLSKEA